MKAVFFVCFEKISMQHSRNSCRKVVANIDEAATCKQ